MTALESAHVVSINLPGVGGKFARMRIPICVVPSRKMCDETMDAILEVTAWSLRHLQAGFHPECRHDGSPWNASDKWRSKTHGALGFNASLVEVRGDWDFYSKVFHFPYHSELDGICWLCPCKRKEDFFFGCVGLWIWVNLFSNEAWTLMLESCSMRPVRKLASCWKACFL